MSYRGLHSTLASAGRAERWCAGYVGTITILPSWVHHAFWVQPRSRAISVLKIKEAMVKYPHLKNEFKKVLQWERERWRESNKRMLGRWDK